MDKMERRALKKDAAESLAGASYSPGRLMLIHTAVSSGLALLIALLSFLLDQQIAGTGGLGGMGNRAVLETLQSLLEMANMVMLPFWGMGLVWVFVNIGRYQGAEPRDLLTGFRLFGPVLRTKLLQILVFMGAIFLGCYLGIFVYSCTPLSASLYEAAEPYMVDGMMDYAAMDDPAFMAAAMWAVPFMLLGAAGIAVPLYYRLRLMDYVLLDHPEKGAMFAMRFSKGVMRGHRWELFKLDLSFWWFYALEALVVFLSYGDLILPMLGVDLGMSQTVAFFVFYVLALLAQLGLYVWKRPLVMATYARYYDAVRPRPREEVSAEQVEN